MGTNYGTGAGGNVATVATFLQTVPLFASLSNDHLIQLAADSRPRHLEKYSFLFFQGDQADSIYVVRRGWMVIMLTSSDGRELVLSEMRRGDIFGENAILTGATRSATASTRDESELIEISGDAFLAVLAEDPLLARRLLELAAARQAASNQREGALAFLHAGARIARILRSLDEMDRRTADKGYVTISQDELAQRTGLTRQTVARFLGRWRRQGWLLTGRGRIMLLNRDALAQIETV